MRDQIQFEDHLTAMALHGIATVGFKILEGVSSAEQPVSEILLQESARWHNWKKRNSKQVKFSMMRPSTACMGIGHAQDADDTETKARTGMNWSFVRFFSWIFSGRFWPLTLNHGIHGICLFKKRSAFHAFLGLPSQLYATPLLSFFPGSKDCCTFGKAIPVKRKRRMTVNAAGLIKNSQLASLGSTRIETTNLDCGKLLQALSHLQFSWRFWGWQGSNSFLILRFCAWGCAQFGPQGLALKVADESW